MTDASSLDHPKLTKRSRSTSADVPSQSGTAEPQHDSLNSYLQHESDFQMRAFADVDETDWVENTGVVSDIVRLL